MKTITLWYNEDFFEVPFCNKKQFKYIWYVLEVNDEHKNRKKYVNICFL
jgi:hypothetical protein